MSKFAGAMGGQALTITGAVVVAVGVAGAYLGGMFDPKEPVAVEQPAPTPAPTPAAAPKSEAKPEVKPEVKPEPVAEAPKPAPEPEPAVYDPPRFDVVRVEPDGSTLVAGVAAVGAKLDVLLDEAVLQQTEPGSDGKFATFLAIAPSQQPRVLSLLMRIDGQEIASDASVIIAPVVQVAEATPEPEATPETQPEPAAKPESAEAEEAVAEDAPAQKQPAQPAAAEPEQPVDVAEAPAPAEQPADQPKAPAEIAENEPTPEPVSEPEPAPAPEPAQPKAPAVILADKDGVKVVQPAEAADAPGADVTVAIDAISYSAQGDVTIAGRGKPGKFVQIYLNNAAAGGTGISLAGTWDTILTGVAAGIYTLRVDEVDETGKVLSRIETPFKREAPETVAAAPEPAQPSAPAPKVRVVTVQPGSTLWAIARDKYGDGVMYVRVYEANKERIRNPDLIYPGQVFVVPE